MFEKILIANRGEIAIRIIRTCNRLGISTVAVYSDADSRSLHRHLADEAVHIGESPSQKSYLDIDKIIAAAKKTGAQAIHPGYGFLSEKADFAQAIKDAGLVLIGPSVEAIDVMGDKITSKELAKNAGVPVIPGHIEAIKDEKEAIAIAAEIGYPILLKPAAGGGGKGMRIVRAPEDMKEALEASRKETQKAFNDTRVFVERYIEQPRHIEIQVLADSFGNVIHLGERECSIQRRYQKVIEESPSPAVSPDLRERMGKAACDLARQANYVNAGTVEFVLDAHQQFYFLEMNTRLQVEHPVTEMVTGLDLVEWQLRIASGEPLPFDQKGVRFNGWAIEARICAEDPSRGFIPSTGMITRYAAPRGTGIRVDSGVNIGGKVDVYYDSMLAKLICHGKTREDARRSLIEALNGYHIEGVSTNIDFVTSVLCLPEFAEGNLHTGFIEQHFDGGKSKRSPAVHYLRLAALVATLIYHTREVAVRESMSHMVSSIGGKRKMGRFPQYMVRCEDDHFNVALENPPISGETCTMRVDGNLYQVEIPYFEFFRRRLKLVINGQVYRFRIQFDESFMFVSFNGLSRLFEVYTPKEWAMMTYMPEKADKSLNNVLLCPMPGLVVDVLAQKGERVFRGQNLVILESMKMESGVASPVDGIIAEVLVAKGQAVEADETLIKFEVV
ncbi:acetyl-CoA carboxylase, biotin carboxylase [Desulfobulbus propionicus DSM 2032]|jgi:propionyl-CoA carboxylase alpha chain|uniref:Acetyl-CoA carboxylase, biotin carboxylase n=1 Tax=Desulfobulbus propionicus (strain ATCC 33891 / DSM 2032 / VKM B-1956 / 1pr3) TaxID=577650 RepID=A0A7U4DQH2_DESPD|nr:acetyl-CoA carboxylase biotin carboxylase subunit [Desulfobulbus propionicus]ADW19017.1 acetyl-CoA carboxylase, biotin carboxylase [Desulfobulbus propionicus DSM 2032]